MESKNEGLEDDLSEGEKPVQNGKMVGRTALCKTGRGGFEARERGKRRTGSLVTGRGGVLRQKGKAAPYHIRNDKWRRRSPYCCHKTRGQGPPSLFERSGSARVQTSHCSKKRYFVERKTFMRGKETEKRNYLQQLEDRWRTQTSIKSMAGCRKKISIKTALEAR